MPPPSPANRPCQFPTLGFIVTREREIRAHVPEDFWQIAMTYTEGNRSCAFEWARGRIFDHVVAVAFLQARRVHLQPALQPALFRRCCRCAVLLAL